MIKIGDKFKYLKYALLTFILVMFSYDVLAKINVQATVPQNVINLDENIVLTISVSSDESFDASEPRLPQLDGFQLVNSWTSSSTSSKMIQTGAGMQFQTVRQQDFNYQLTPTKAGKIQIPGFEVVVDGKNYNTKPFVISVEKSQGGGGGGHQPPRGKARRPNPYQQIPGMPDMNDIDDAEEMFNQLLQRRMGKGGGAPPPPANVQTKHNPNEAFFVQVELDKTKVFEGEQITATWYLYSRGNILSLDRAKMPELKGFWKEVIEEVPALNFEQVIVNGVPYRRAMLATHALFPIKAGVAVVDEYKIKASVQLAGSFGFGPAYTYTKSSERIKIDVESLPLGGRPKDFNGAVGEFELNTSIEEKNFFANQPFTLKVRFDGTGNAKIIDMPSLQLAPGLELYDTKSESKFFKNGHSYKEFDVLIIPRESGEITIPPVSVSMFDPVHKKYYSKKTEQIKIKIAPAAAVAVVKNEASMSLSKDKVEVKKKPLDLPELILAPQILMKDTNMQFYFQIALWFFVFIILVVKAKQELVSVSYRKDLKQALSQRAKKIDNLIEKNEWRNVASEALNLIYFILGELSEQKGASQQFDKLLDSAPPSVRRETGEILLKSVQVFQTVGFAPPELIGKYKDKAELRQEFDKTLKALKKALDVAGR